MIRLLLVCFVVFPIRIGFLPLPKFTVIFCKRPDKQEEYQIKNVCLMAIIELLLSCKMYPVVGDRLNSMFHHVPRLLSPKSDSIG